MGSTKNVVFHLVLRSNDKEGEEEREKEREHVGKCEIVQHIVLPRAKYET